MLVSFLRQFYLQYQGHHLALDLELSKLIEALEHSSFNDQSLMSQALKDTLRQPVNRASQNISDISLLDSICHLLSLYRNIILQFDTHNKEQKRTEYKLINSCIDELINTSDDVKVHTSLQDELDLILKSLKKTSNNSQLYTSFHKMILLLFNNINKEKDASKFFFDSLNKALLDVKNVVVDSTVLAQGSVLNNLRWDQDLVKNIDKISDVLNSSKNTLTIQADISKTVNSIMSAVKEKGTFDKDYQESLLSHLRNMEQKLATVEKEALGYKAKLDKHKILSMQDKLTKLPNRAALDEKFLQEFNIAKKQGTPLWVAVADLDYFKKVNDTFGHTAGDKTLQTVASLLNRSLRENEFIARFGGEEFVILVPNISQVGIEKKLNRVREKIKSIPFKFKGTSMTISISIGATKVRIDDAGEYFTFERADKALYQAKEQGRDRVVII
ncbi:MAG: GGDEF domain-containing protein [Gammaproteobacteria bacterium]|nr:GGDEF domain-containing protein [Gammaproteobacteria bacterium]